MKTIIKKILLIYISLVLTFAPSSIVYAASAGGWAFSAFDVSKSLVTAMKNGASASVAVAKSPITAKIGKGILGGAIAGAAIPLALNQITGLALEAIDWVFDPANNAVKYKSKVPTGTYTATYNTQTFSGSSIDTICSDYFNWAKSNIGPLQGRTDIITRISNGRCSIGYGGSYYWSITPSFVATPNDWKSIPIPTVADKIYDNAKTDSNSRSVVNDAVRDYVNEGSADTALDNAKTDADATHNCGTGTHWSGSACVADTPTTPSTPTTDTPFDPSSILAAIASLFDAVMSIPDVINTAIDSLLNDIKDFFQPVIDALESLITKLTEFFDAIIAKFDDFVAWVKQEPPQDESPKNVPDGQLSDVGLENQDRFQARITFPAQCPSQQLTFNYFGRTYSHEIPFQALCQVLEMVAPIFVGVACLGVAFYIVREV